MSENIIAGDDGTVLQFNVKSNGSVVDVRGGSVRIDFRVKSRTFSKQATIVDGQNGIVQVVTSSEDIADPGSYYWRGLVTLSNGNSFHSDKDYFNVEDATV